MLIPLLLHKRQTMLREAGIPISFSPFFLPLSLLATYIFLLGRRRY